ncbi:MAG TPA: glycoside hydrolase family 2 TIM barrel-domain containing protein [Opitutaceae bacterium]|nr:glycoside hydrolase family 2 TIM barrel-domain containing protein [Opitutaceae bacterium]
MTSLARLLFAFSTVCCVSLGIAADASQTERRYLSGQGPADAVPWEFSVTGGRRAGEKTTILVPSQWELQGFGSYQYGQAPGHTDEHGLYRTKFTLPAEWRGRRVRIVFGGVMTDTKVTVNGRPAGPVHQGGFMQFRYDISNLVKFDAENVLEVDVAKVSANADTERAERGGDYWIFGGIYRAVWLEAVPAQDIEQVAIDARADGSLTADVTLASAPTNVRPDGPALAPERVEAQVLDADGHAVGDVFSAKIPAGGIGRLRLATHIASPRLWTAETPALYTLRVARLRGSETVHSVTRRFGFRTFEVRDGEGLFLNGQRILLKGVNRHSFRPETGRALNREDCYADVRLIRQMNMNAVRMSHYPPDEAFLEACDELGLYVLDELSGWQHAHDTVVGRLLVREMVERDVNHPSILFWDNGNEGGFNRDLDGEYSLYDPQQRRVLHPWDPFGGIDAKHYTSYDDHVRRLRGPNLVMPTEILHALYDGGAGAGLEDYWRATTSSAFGAGMFIWDFADEGVVRTDEGGRVDVFSTFAPDGIVGPHFEKEGSFYAVRDVWSPVQIDAPTLDAKFDGTLAVHNRYDFTSLAQCRFAWRLVSFAGAEKTLAEGASAGPAVAAHADGKLALALPADWQKADALAVTATDPRDETLWTWTWPTAALASHAATMLHGAGNATPRVEKDANAIRLVAGEVVATFDGATGRLQSFARAGKQLALTNGPRLAFARPLSAGKSIELPWRTDAAEGALTRFLATPQLANAVDIETDATRGTAYFGLKLELSADGATWRTIFDGTRRPGDGARYDFPPQRVAAVRVSNVRFSDGQPATVKKFVASYAAERFPAESGAGAALTSGTARDEQSGAVAWLESRGGGGLDRFRWTLAADGGLRLDYSYTLDGDFVYHGVTFDHAEDAMKSLRWLGEGPNRVWQNRLRGTWLGFHEVAQHALQPGESFAYPEFDGYFAGVRWARLDTAAGALELAPTDPKIFVRVGTPRIDHPNTTADFPAGDVSFLHAIAGMGSKFKTPEQSGPSALPAKAHGRYDGSVVFRIAN